VNSKSPSELDAACLAEPPPRQLAGPSALPSAPPDLFRREVLAGRQAQWLGRVVLVPRPSHRLFAAFGVLAIAGVVALLWFGSYTHKARINGWLVPDLGLVRLVAPQPGVVTEVYVKEGDEVGNGAPLLLLSTEVESEAVGATRKQVVRRLRDRRDSLTAERERQQQLYTQQTEQAVARLAAMTNEREQLQRAIEIQQSRVQLADRTLEQMRELRGRQLVTEQRLQAAEQDKLDQAVKLKEYQRKLAGLDQDLVKLRGELAELPLRQQTQLGETDRNIAALDQELAEAESRRQILLTAPQAGTISAIQAAPGSNVNTTVPLLSIVPAGSVLQAQLFSPSRSIGFVQPGQRVLLRYQAFPYQKFGFYEGHVVDVSRASLSPSELPLQLSGLTSLYGSTEPVYRITVDLAKQTATAYGKPAGLQPGMQLEADVLIETRSLIEWVLDPLYTLTGGRSQ
jgi:membrane fusion protein